MFAAQRQLVQPNYLPFLIPGSAIATNGTSSSQLTMTSAATQGYNGIGTYLVAICGGYSISNQTFTCAWGGMNMTLMETATESSYVKTAMFGLQLPNTWNGNGQFTFTSNHNGFMGMACFALQGYFKEVAVGANNANGALATVSVASTPGQIIVGGFTAWNALTVTGGTQAAQSSYTDAHVAAIYRPALVTSTALGASLTSTYWSGVAVALQPVF